MHVKIGVTFSLCTLSPWIKGLEDELTFTRVDYRHGYVPAGEPKRTFTPKRLYHIPEEAPTEGTFSAGLLPRVLEWLQARGHTHEIEDYRDLAAMKPMPDFSKVGLLRPGQPEALIQIAHADMGIIVAATAFGKSFVITQACRMYPTLRFLVVSPRVAVVDSLRRKLEEAVGKENVGQAGGGKRILGRRVMVTTTKSMTKVDPSEVDILFFDEVHGVGDNEVASTLAYYGDCRRFGFTASPVRGDRSEMCMEALFGRFLIEVSYQDAVELGNVVPIDVWMVRVTGNIPVANSIYENKRRAYWTNDHRNDVIAKVARKFPPEQQCLIMVETLEHAVHLHQRLPEYTLVHFGAVKLDYHAHEWRELTPPQQRRVPCWVKDGEEYRPLQNKLIEHGGMTRQRTGVGEDHRPWHIAHLAPQLPVDEVPQTPGTETDGDERGDKIHCLPVAVVVLALEQPQRDQHAEQAAVEGHAPLPDLEQHQRVFEKHREIVEKRIANAPTQHHAEGDIEDDVVDLLGGPAGVGLGGADTPQPPAAGKTDKVHNAVPVNLERAEAKGNGINVGISQHRGSITGCV